MDNIIEFNSSAMSTASAISAIGLESTLTEEFQFHYYVYWALLIQIVLTFPNQRTGPSGPSQFRVAKPGTLRVP